MQQRKISTDAKVIRVKPQRSVGDDNAIENTTVPSNQSADATAPNRRSRRRCRVVVDISACRYAIIRRCLRERGFRLVKAAGGAEIKWDIWWSDRGDLLKDLPRLNPFQKINHFPSMDEICRKDFLANNLNAMYKVLPEDYGFFPRSFLLPADRVELQQTMESGPKNATYIVKPRTLCQGKGISLVQSFTKIPNEACVVQRYIDDPLLIDGYKFDLRIYVLVFSVHPLQIYIFRNGLARFCTSPFCKPSRKNLNQKRMHLTNYAINKRSKNFQEPTNSAENKGSKRSLAAIMSYLDQTGAFSSQDIWLQIHDIVVKTVLAIQPKLVASYKSFFGNSGESTWGPKCFEILGFDVMLDAVGKAWLVEVNHAPSFAGDSALDREIKSALINNTLDLVGVTNEKKRQFVRQRRVEWSKRLWSGQPTRKQTEICATKVPSKFVEATHTSEKEIEPQHDEGANTQEMIGHSTDEESVASLEDEDDDHGKDEYTGDRCGKAQARQLVEPTSTPFSSIRTFLTKKNRICPTHTTDPLLHLSTPSTTQTSTASHGTDFTNEYMQVYPISIATHAEIQHTVCHTTDTICSQRSRIETYQRVQAAAEVNKSKLWN